MSKKSTAKINAVQKENTRNLLRILGNLQAAFVAEDTVMEEILGEPRPRIHHSILPENLDVVGARIYVVVAETLTYDRKGKPASYKMETGRQMAQACHAVSALKLYYCERQSRDQKLRSNVIQLMERPITTIVLKARNSEEIKHVCFLAEKENILHFCFRDDNAAVYGTEESIPSAVAIGPIYPSQAFGVTDYLPLWKDGVTDIG